MIKLTDPSSSSFICSELLKKMVGSKVGNGKSVIIDHLTNFIFYQGDDTKEIKKLMLATEWIKNWGYRLKIIQNFLSTGDIGFRVFLAIVEILSFDFELVFVTFSDQFDS